MTHSTIPADQLQLLLLPSLTRVCRQLPLSIHSITQLQLLVEPHRQSMIQPLLLVEVQRQLSTRPRAQVDPQQRHSTLYLIQQDPRVKVLQQHLTPHSSRVDQQPRPSSRRLSLRLIHHRLQVERLHTTQRMAQMCKRR